MAEMDGDETLPRLIPACHACHRTDLPINSVCSGCENVAYCSVECQRSRWREHKQRCNFKESNERTKNAVPMDEDTTLAGTNSFEDVANVAESSRENAYRGRYHGPYSRRIIPLAHQTESYRVQRPEQEGEWWSVTEDKWRQEEEAGNKARLRNWTHIGLMMETTLGFELDEADRCQHCQNEGGDCTIYHQEAPVTHKGISCARCRHDPKAGGCTGIPEKYFSGNPRKTDHRVLKRAREEGGEEEPSRLRRLLPRVAKSVGSYSEALQYKYILRSCDVTR